MHFKLNVRREYALTVADAIRKITQADNIPLTTVGLIDNSKRACGNTLALVNAVKKHGKVVKDKTTADKYVCQMYSDSFYAV